MSKCIHYWIVETPQGIMSKGMCRKCGEERDFYNAPAYMREDGNQWHRANKGSWLAKQKLEELSVSSE